jgi:hypothetical protein
MKPILSIVGILLAYFLVTSWFSDGTQHYIDTCNKALFHGFAEADKCWTVGGANDEMLKAIAQAEAIPAPGSADEVTVRHYRQFLQEGKEWFDVRPSWRTNLLYGGAGIVTGAIDFLGASGAATTALAGAGTMDLDNRNQQFKQMQNALESLRSHCVKSGYNLGF